MTEEKGPNIGKKNGNDIIKKRNKHTDGSFIWAETSITFILDYAERIFGMPGSTRNITERKQADKKLQDSEEKINYLEAIINGNFTDSGNMEKIIAICKDVTEKGNSKKSLKRVNRITRSYSIIALAEVDNNDLKTYQIAETNDLACEYIG